MGAILGNRQPKAAHMEDILFARDQCIELREIQGGF